MVSKTQTTSKPRVARKKTETEREIVQVFFRAPAEIMEKVDQAAKSGTIPSSRQNWILEAIVEKLDSVTEHDL